MAEIGQDMRAGIQRLAAIVAADFGRDPMDGALYCFVSRDCEKAKILRFDVNGWCLYYVRLTEDGFKWRHAEGGELLPQVERRQQLWRWPPEDASTAKAGEGSGHHSETRQKVIGYNTVSHSEEGHWETKAVGGHWE